MTAKPEPLARLSASQSDELCVQGDLAEVKGDHAKAELCRIEVSIGAAVIRGPGQHGYHPMMARIGASLGMKHDPRVNRLV